MLPRAQLTRGEAGLVGIRQRDGRSPNVVLEQRVDPPHRAMGERQRVLLGIASGDPSA